MKPRHSASLLLVWQIAELEARHLHAQFLGPNHLFIGLCKIVDLDLTAIVAKDMPDRDAVLEELLREVRRLRTIFRNADVDPRRLRRVLRCNCEGSRDTLMPKGRLHRTQPSKDVFADAEQFAGVSAQQVFPVHLLYALLLQRDSEREDTMRQLGFDLKHLTQAAEHDALSFPTTPRTPCNESLN